MGKQHCPCTDMPPKLTRKKEVGVTADHQISFSVLGSRTTRLSLGERPVLAPDSVASAPELTRCVPGSYCRACAHGRGTHGQFHAPHCTAGRCTDLNIIRGLHLKYKVVCQDIRSPTYARGSCDQATSACPKSAGKPTTAGFVERATSLKGCPSHRKTPSAPSRRAPRARGCGRRRPA